MSRNHAKILGAGGDVNIVTASGSAIPSSFRVLDGGGVNGTYLNGVRVRPARLRQKNYSFDVSDCIFLGKGQRSHSSRRRCYRLWAWTVMRQSVRAPFSANVTKNTSPQLIRPIDDLHETHPCRGVGIGEVIPERHLEYLLLFR